MHHKYEKIKVWKRAGFRLTLWDTFRRDVHGKTFLKYRFLDNGKEIFAGEDYRPGIGTPIDSLSAVYGLLGFLSLRPGDTDKEYFEKYSPAQMTWEESDRAETLSLFVYDFENGRMDHK